MREGGEARVRSHASSDSLLLWTRRLVRRRWLSKCDGRKGRIIRPFLDKDFLRGQRAFGCRGEA